MSIILYLKGEFEAAHQIKNHEGKCQNLHGHNYKIDIQISGKKLNDKNLIYDAGHFKNFLDRYDHKYLNDVFNEDNITIEYMVREIGEELQTELNKLINKPFLKYIIIKENDKTFASIKYEDLND